MLPGAYDLELYRGDTARWQFALWQDAGRTVAVSLGGASAAAQIRDSADSETVLGSLLAQIVLPNIINVTLTAGSAATLPPQGVWDLQLTYADGTVQTIVAGMMLVVADVTRG